MYVPASPLCEPGLHPICEVSVSSVIHLLATATAVATHDGVTKVIKEVPLYLRLEDEVMLAREGVKSNLCGEGGKGEG